jgi:putative transcriptional regulator
MAYSGGDLPEAFNLVVATHVSLCDVCRALLASFDAVGGAILADAEAATMSEDSLASCLDRIEMLPQATTRQPLKRVGCFPAPLADYIDGGPDQVKWRPLGMGVKQAILPTGSDASARLLYIPAGQAVPDHGHRGLELTLVLQGAFRDDSDRFGPGDIEIADEAVEHTPVAEDGPACICLAATDAPLRFNALIPRLAQPFLRI